MILGHLGHICEASLSQLAAKKKDIPQNEYMKKIPNLGESTCEPLK